MQTISKPLINLFTLILLGFIWGTGYSIARFAMTNGVPPLGYSFWQSLGPAIIIGGIALYRFRHIELSIAHARFYLICGLTGIAIPNTSMYFAAPHLPAGILAMIVNTVPVMAYPLALFMRVEKFNWQRLLGIVLAFAGLMLVILPKSNLPTSDGVFWLLATLITPLSFAICSIYIARFAPRNSDIVALTAGMLIFSSLLLLPLVLSTHNFYLLHMPLSSADWVIILEIILSSIGYLLFFYLIKTAGPVYYSLVDTIVVLTGIFWGFMIFAEKLNQWTTLSVILIITALLLVTHQQRIAMKRT